MKRIGDEYYDGNPRVPAHICLRDGIFGYDVCMGHADYSDDNGYLELHSAMYHQYTAVTQQRGVEFVGSLMPGFNNRATRPVCRTFRRWQEGPVRPLLKGPCSVAS
jgi:hypothetical protein